LLGAADIVSPEKLATVREECDELTAIFVSIIKKIQSSAREPLIPSF